MGSEPLACVLVAVGITLVEAVAVAVDDVVVLPPVVALPPIAQAPRTSASAQAVTRTVIDGMRSLPRQPCGEDGFMIAAFLASLTLIACRTA